MKKLIIVLFIALFVTQVSAATTYTCVSLGKTYTFSANPSLSYPDDGTKLTDGIYATTKDDYYYKEDVFVGFNQISFDTEGDFYVTIDLGEVMDYLKEFEFCFLNEPVAGIFAPASVTVFIADEEEGPYTSLGTIEIHVDTSEDSSLIGNDVVKLTDEVSGRYVRFMFHSLGEFENSNGTMVTAGWIFLDELSVYGTVETPDTGDVSRTVIIAAILLIVSAYLMYKVSRLFKHRSKI